MPLYELLVITIPDINKARLGLLLKNVATLVLKSNGVVRKFEDLKMRELPFPMSSHQAEPYKHGYFWTMTFDINPNEFARFKNQLDLDRRVIKHNIIKIGNTFEETVLPME